MIDELVVAGGTIETVTIENGPFRAEFLNLGASLRSLTAPDLRGEPGNVVLGYRDLEQYRGRPRFYGAVAGRYANRIGGARFSLDGRAYDLPKNNGAHNLHSGPLGFDQRFWAIEGHDARSVHFSLLSPAGENGFPGNLHVDLHYALEADGLAIRFAATTDAATVVNLTHHAYFNLAGEDSGQSVLGQWLQIPAGRFTPVEDQIPTGVLQDVAGTPFDFLRAKPIGADIVEQDEQLRARQRLRP
ncbi:MAG: aldose epimerase family protein [Sphingomonas sp.]